jgi:methyl coenzyme M reductase alpha subunit
MQIRKAYNDSTVKLSLTSSSGIVLGGAAGTVVISATKTQTAGISVDYLSLFYHDNKPSQKMVYDLELETSGGVVTRLLQGVAFIYPEVTQ